MVQRVHGRQIFRGWHWQQNELHVHRGRLQLVDVLGRIRVLPSRDLGTCSMSNDDRLEEIR